MQNFKIYGESPYENVLVHGGPGARGEMMPVASKLSYYYGVVEHLQNGISLEEQIDELKDIIDNNSDYPVNLIGFSWGAWLSFIFASRYPALVKKLILIGCAPFDENNAATIQETRLKRLSDEEKAELKSHLKVLMNPSYRGNKPTFSKFAELFSKADAYAPTDLKIDSIDFRIDIFQGVWPEASALRRSGKLLKMGEKIECPVFAIHGDFDTHSAEGVIEPLSKTLKNFKFVILKNCGHKPWIEKFAKIEFYNTLKKILKDESFKNEEKNS